MKTLMHSMKKKYIQNYSISWVLIVTVYSYLDLCFCYNVFYFLFIFTEDYLHINVCINFEIFNESIYFPFTHLIWCISFTININFHYLTDMAFGIHFNIPDSLFTQWIHSLQYYVNKGDTKIKNNCG